MENNKSLSRRTFLKKGTSATLSVPLASSLVGLGSKKVAAAPSPLNQWPGRVVVNYNNTHDATPAGGTAADETILKKMIDDSITLLTGETDIGEAWKLLFPVLTSTTKIAVKINCTRCGHFPQHPFLVMGITEGLQQMMVGGNNFPAGNIYMYEGYGSENFNTAGFTASRFPSVNIAMSSASNHGDGAWSNSPYSNTLHDCDYLINVPSIRGHSSNYGGVTMGFKSHYGTYPPNHSSNYSEHLRDINCTGPVYDKTVLTVFAAILSANEIGGPRVGPHNFNTYAKTMDPDTDSQRSDLVIMSTDPVAAEFQGIKVQKINRGRGYAISDMPAYLRASGGVSGSLSTVYNIGEIDETQLDYREIINETPTTNVNSKPAQVSEGGILVNPNPANPFAYIDIFTPDDFSGKKALVEIFDVKGRRVRKITLAVLGRRNRAVWNGRDSRNRPVSSGKYLVRTQLGTRVLKKAFTLMQ